MQQRIFLFETKDKSRDGRGTLVAIPENQITKVTGICGGEAVDLWVNGKSMEGGIKDFLYAWQANQDPVVKVPPL